MCPATRGVSTRLTKRAIRLTRVSCKHITTGYRENCLSPYTSIHYSPTVQYTPQQWAYILPDYCPLLPHPPCCLSLLGAGLKQPSWLHLLFLQWTATTMRMIACHIRNWANASKNSLSVGKDPFICMHVCVCMWLCGWSCMHVVQVVLHACCACVCACIIWLTQEMHLWDTCPTHNDKEELGEDWCQQLQECAQVIHYVSSKPVEQCMTEYDTKQIYPLQNSRHSNWFKVSQLL